MEPELREEVEGVGNGARVHEVERLLAFGKAGSDRDLVLSMLLSALLRLELFSAGSVSSSSSSLVLFNDDERGEGISPTSISVSGRCCFLGCCCCCCFRSFCWLSLLLLLPLLLLLLFLLFLLQRFLLPLLLLYLLRQFLR